MCVLPQDGARAHGTSPYSLCLFPCLPSAWPADRSLVGRKFVICLCVFQRLSILRLLGSQGAGRGQPTATATERESVCERCIGVRWSEVFGVYCIAKVPWGVSECIYFPSRVFVLVDVFIFVRFCSLLVMHQPGQSLMSCMCWFCKCLLAHKQNFAASLRICTSVIL